MGSKEIREGLGKAVVENPQCFDCRKEGNGVVWKLKPDIIETGLAGFLKRYYNDFDGGRYSRYHGTCKWILEYLSKGPSRDELYKWLEEGHCGIRIKNDEWRLVHFAECMFRVNISYMELTYEGKVTYEELERHVRFFESALRRAYVDDALGGCSMVKIG